MILRNCFDGDICHLRAQDDSWTATLSAKVDNLEGKENISLSVGRDFKNPRANLSFSVGQRNGKDSYASVGYIAKL